ncbi:MAG: hydrogenase small subunit [Gammaproteobacteria bacterium]|nr:hydrogenase small subunit [Gammaproteobacteria bacterium]MBT8075654.1 hydrogenase small subunit [Gammaproteobacteria bacterium]NNL00158.1 hydrogenase small subunit [Xanthomonadales bacterium]
MKKDLLLKDGNPQQGNPLGGTLGESLRSQGVSRRSFMKFCATTASMMALPPSMIPMIANALENARRPSVIWLSFQECTGCTESLTRAHTSTVESLIFDAISLDYHHTLQAASGHAAEAAREVAMEENFGNYLLVVDGSIPLDNPGYSTIAGISNLDMLTESAKGAAAIVAVGTCATYGGIPHANPNPTGAVSVKDIIKDKPIINVPGCPPIPVVITGVLAHYLTFGAIPELDHIGRPKVFYGQSIHDRCYRRPFYDKGQFAETFDDEGAKKGWCLYKLGCKGPTTYNACATTKWNNGTSFPIESGHPCIGCSEPDFWDGGGFYKALSLPTEDLSKTAVYAAAGAAAAGVAVSALNRGKKNASNKIHIKTTIDDLTQE